MKRVVAALTLALAAPLLPVLPVPPAHADGTANTGIGIRLLDAPADRRNDPRARVYIVDHVSPGATFSRKVEVDNDTQAAVDLALYAVGSEIAKGSFTPYTGRTPDELSTWMTVEPATVHLAPGAKATAVVRLVVPADAAPGERYAAVMAEKSGRSAAGIAINDRVGIRTYLDVGTGGEPASDFTVDALTPARDAAGRPVVKATVHNTGGRALDMSGTLTLSSGPGGLSAGPFPAELGTTLGIGQSSPVTVILDKALPPGPWKARIDLKSGLLERAAEATITFPQAAATSSPPVTAKAVPLTKDFNVLVPIAVGLIVLVLAGLLWLLWRRRRRRDDDEQQPSSTPPALPGQRRADDDRAVR